MMRANGSRGVRLVGHVPPVAADGNLGPPFSAGITAGAVGEGISGPK